MSSRSLFCLGNYILIFGLSAAVLCIGRWIYTFMTGTGSYLPDFWAILFLIMSVILLDMYRLQPATSHTILSLVIQYVFHKLAKLMGKIGKMQYVKQSKACKVTQERLLFDILKQNENTLFYKDFDLNRVKSVDDYRRLMPLTTYSDYSKYVDMVTENGTENVLFPGKAIFAALTSGTTSGKSKAYPKSSKSKRIMMSGMMLMQAAMSALGVDILMKMVYIRVCAKISKCKSGIDCGPISAFMTSKVPFVTVDLDHVYSEFEAVYIQLVFALREDDVAFFTSQLATTGLVAFNIIEKFWQAICKDIESGKLSAIPLDIPKDGITRLNNMLKPRQERAEFLRREFGKGLKDIVPRIWPSCPCLLASKTGVFESAGKALEDKYLGSLPCVTLLHVGTESIYGTNIFPLRDTVSFAPYININFFEFIPEEDMNSEIPRTMLCHQVEIGKTYEMVITTYEGLYRYRTEDMVQITEFFNTTPLYKFVRRAGDILSVETDKVPEFLLHDAIKEAAQQWKTKVVEFTSCESIHVNMLNGSNDDFKHYVVLIETENTTKLTDRETKMVDAGLCRRHDVYAAMRRNNKLQQLQLIQLKPGTFDKLKQKMLEINPSAFCMQIKVPRILRRENLLQFVLDHKL